MKKSLIVVLYGSTGDLTFRKLLPSFINLYNEGKIDDNSIILALGRRDFTTNDYLDFIKKNNELLDINVLSKFVKYFKMQITDENDFEKLNDELELHSDNKTKVIHYLAIAPELMLDVSKYISKYKVVSKGNLNQRLIFEKPFGSSYKTSHIINEELWKMYLEEQIFRIDHYLGKKIVKEIVNLKFNDNILKHYFEAKNLSKIEIFVKEKDGILNRGSFYDVTGATKDMFQSHILQMISLLLMEEPKKFNSNEIINEKVKVIRNLSYDKKKIVFGQYNGYLKEENVSDKSLIDTLLKIELKVSNSFRKVMVNVLTGKRLSEKATKIILTLKDQRKLMLNIYPNNEIVIDTIILGEKVVFNDLIKKNEDEYANLIMAAVNNQKEMFVRWDEIEYSWKFVDELLKTKKELKIYNNENDLEFID